MDKRKISITIWGKEKGNWLEWYKDVADLMTQMGYKNTHIGITTKSYNTGKVVTVARKEKEILTRIKDGELPRSFSCFSLPKDYRSACFDYYFLCVRTEEYMSVIINDTDFNTDIEQQIISLIYKYTYQESGEIYSTSVTEASLLYAETKDIRNLKTYKLIRNLE